jgi:hypothetical protein
MLAGLPAVSSAAVDKPAPTLVVATDGDDAGPGTLEQPFASVQHAVDEAGPGDVIAIRSGTYAVAENVQIDHSGEPGNPITLTAYGDEHVVIDGEQLPASHTPLGGSIPNSERGVIHQQNANHWHVSDLEIIRGPYAYYCRDCSNNVFERMTTRDNYETGFQIQGASSNNLVVDLDSYGNRDPRKNGESADGLGIKEGSGDGNVVRGARLWNNVDDGFDAWEFLSPITIEDGLTYGNGVNRWGFPDFAGDGNGFKLGGGDDDFGADHVLSNVAAFDNVADGFTDNGNLGSLRIGHATAWDNGEVGFDLDSSTSAITDSLAVDNATAAQLGGSTSTRNSWDGGGTWDAGDLRSADPSIVTGPRTGGGIPHDPDFLVPEDGSTFGARF